MTGHNNGARLRAGLATAAVAAALLAVAWGGSPADAALAPRDGAAAGGYLYWTNAAAVAPGNGTIGRARLNGTDVDQKFITGASLPTGLTTAGGYLYWANNLTGTIGRARLNGTDVNQKFIKTAQSEGPDDVVADSGHIYWANDFNIGRANLNGTDVNRTSSPSPTAPAASPRWLSTPATLLDRRDRRDDPPGPAQRHPGEPAVHHRRRLPQTGLAVDSRYIYWINETTGTIGRARLNGTDVNQKFIKVPNAHILLGVAVDPRRHD